MTHHDLVRTKDASAQCIRPELQQITDLCDCPEVDPRGHRFESCPRYHRMALDLA